MNRMQVENKIFYHTSTTEEGQNYFDSQNTFTISAEKNNPRFNTLINYRAPSLKIGNKELDWLRYLDFLVEFGKKYGKLPIGCDLRNLLEGITFNTYFINNRYYEKIFEKIRETEFNDLPSRYSCIYLADKNNIEYWHEKALKETGKKELPIYEFSANGRIHYADSEWLEVGIVSDKEFEDVARKYWKGDKNPTSRTNTMEILFCGNLYLNKKYENLDDFKNRV